MVLPYMKLQGILSGCSTVFFSCELLWHIVTPFPSTRCRCRFREPLYGIRSFGSFLRKHRYNSHGPRVAFVVVMTTARPPYSCFLIPLVLFGQLGTRGKKKKKKAQNGSISTSTRLVEKCSMCFDSSLCQYVSVISKLTKLWDSDSLYYLHYIHTSW